MGGMWEEDGRKQEAGRRGVKERVRERCEECGKKVEGRGRV
jgi:hypothetical protein